MIHAGDLMIKNHTPIIEGLDIESGSRGRGFLEAGPYFDNRAGATTKIREYVRIPFTVIKGANEGPTLCVTAGVHPTEYAGIDAAIRLSNEVKPEELKGRLIIVPVVNLPGFWARSYLCPIDGVDICSSYRMKGGRNDGTIGEVIAYMLVKEILSKADYHLDLHGTDTSESCVPFAKILKIGDNRIDVESKSMAKALGIELSEYIDIQPRAKIIKIPTASCEVGQGDKLLPELSKALFEGITNVMRYLKMVEGQPRQKDYIFMERKRIFSNHNGLLYLHVKLGDIVEEGQVIGEVKNIEGDVIETICSPYKGVIPFIIHNPVVHAGERVINIGVFPVKTSSIM